MRAITREEAAAVLRAQHLARTTLTGYARYIDIPGVPDDGDVDDRAYEVVETPLATHHVLILNVLQLLVQGLLVYDTQTLDSIVDFASVRGEKRAVGGRTGEGGYLNKTHAPSGNFTSPHTSPQSLLATANRAVEPLSKPADAGSAENTGDIPAKTAISPESELESLRDLLLPVFEGVLCGNLTPEDALRIIGEESPGLVACRRVMLMLPPGSAKSTYASVVFPTWVMGLVKAFEVILTGWGDPICRRHGKRARQICNSPQFSALFGTGLDPNTRAAEDWQLKNFSSYKSSGIQSGVAGFRTHGLVWDDLTKNRKEADSQTIRDDVYNAYIDDARSRKTPTAWEVGIGTRWHEDEIMGRILPEGYNGESGFMRCRDGNVWYIICMAAECEHDVDPLGREKGDMIWPEWFTEEYWSEKRLVPRSWGSLYQQRPAPEEGIIFRKDKFKRYSHLPDGYNVISLDPGVSDSGDQTAMHVWRIDEFARIYLVESFYQRCGMDVWITELVRWCKLYKPNEVISESGVIRRAAEPWIKRAMQKTKTFFSQVWVTRSANKVAMAQSALAMVNSGQVYLPNNSDGDRFIDVCLKFPASKEDHEVDSFANLCLRLETLWEANAPTPTEEQPSVLQSGEIKVSSLMPPRFAKKRSRWSHQRN